MEKCTRCGYTWQSRVKKPKRCPNCKTIYWNVERTRIPRAELEKKVIDHGKM